MTNMVILKHQLVLLQNRLISIQIMPSRTKMNFQCLCGFLIQRYISEVKRLNQINNLKEDTFKAWIWNQMVLERHLNWLFTNIQIRYACLLMALKRKWYVMMQLWEISKIWNCIQLSFLKVIINNHGDLFQVHQFLSIHYHLKLSSQIRLKS